MSRASWDLGDDGPCMVIVARCVLWVALVAVLVIGAVTS